MPALDGSWWKFQRSYDQLKALSKEIGSYGEPLPFCLSFESEIKSRDGICRFIVTEPPPVMWSVQVGEIVHNLRSALEHAVWQLILDSGGSPLPYKTGFPVFIDDVAYLKGRGKRPPGIAMLDGVPEAARDFITSIQPYQSRARSLDPRNDALFVLNELWNIDKHRLLHLMTLGVEGQGLRVSVDGNLLLSGVRIGSRVLQDGAEIVRFPQPVAGKGAVNVNFDVTCEIRLDETVPPAARGDVTEVIGIIGNEVRDVLRVLSGFARG